MGGSDDVKIEWHRNLSFIDAMASAIEGSYIVGLGKAESAGLQFCRGQVRGWVDYDGGERRWFGAELPPGMVQEARIDAAILEKLREILAESDLASRKREEEKAERRRRRK